jgi:predicted AlkP superfamily phosphohydrolase/phosphomutase
MVGRNSDRMAKKVVVLGLDGVSHSLITQYMQQGIMPEFSKLCRGGGQLVRMKSSLPEVSSVAWTSFMTGENPGEHGVFGFMELDRSNYSYTFPNFRSLKKRPFWERENLKTVALNIPQTYPAGPMNGAMVSGFVALDLKKATYPERVFKYLNDISYRLDVESSLAVTNPEAFFQDLFATFAKRKEATCHLYENEEWQLFISTVTETDRLHHFFFESAMEGRYFSVFEKFYRELDGFIGELAGKAARDGAAFITCSDHGFTTITSEVNLNRWLMNNDYLKLNGKSGLTGVSLDSRAFCLDPSRIYIHREGRYQRGAVADSAYEALRSELCGKLKEIALNDQKVVKEVYLKQQIFRGHFTDDGPDLYLLPNYGFDLKASINEKPLFSRSSFTGMHTYDDAHLFSSEGIPLKEPKIEDVAGIIQDIFHARE